MWGWGLGRALRPREPLPLEMLLLSVRCFSVVSFVCFLKLVSFAFFFSSNPLLIVFCYFK